MRLQLILPWLLGGLAAAAAPSTLVAQDLGTSKPAEPRRRLSIAAAVEMSGYTDTDHVNVLSPSVSSTVADSVAGWSVNGRYMVDAVTAASVDIVSSASARWNEKRHVASAGASYKPKAIGVTASGGVSREPDYLSIGAGAIATIDLLDKNLTPFFGLSYGHDDVGRTGLDPAHWTVLQRGALQAGATIVVDRSTIAALQVDASIERGDMGKPYRYIPLFAPGQGGNNLPAGTSVDAVNQIRQDARVLEQLPDARDRYAVTGRVARRFDGITLRLDERGYTDSWGMWASTTDARVMVDVGRRLTLTPHLRFHTQTAVSFWQRAYEVAQLPDGRTGLPYFRAGDRELSWLSTVTAGAGMKLRLTESVHSPWTLSIQIEAANTRYPDTLFIDHRWSLFSAFSLGAEWN